MPLSWTFENEARGQGYSVVAGVDEVGRGPLAGPVVAAAVILPEGYETVGLDDSKKLSHGVRAELSNRLRGDSDVLWAIAESSVEEIDQLNILQASLLAMRRAVDLLKKKPQILLVDGNRDPKAGIKSVLIVKGDSKSPSIAAASILAKEYRDDLMKRMALTYPEYGFEKHMGYGTAYHLEMLDQHGPTPIHRKSFAPVAQLRMKL